MTIASITKDQARALYTFMQEKNETEFFLAKDQGVYFGATSGENETFENSIQYLQGMDPNKDTGEDGQLDWYDNSCAEFGADDFGVHLPIAWLEVFFTAPHMKNKRRFSIRLSANSVKLMQ